jgi:hypothetical protein
MKVRGCTLPPRTSLPALPDVRALAIALDRECRLRRAARNPHAVRGARAAARRPRVLVKARRSALRAAGGDGEPYLPQFLLACVLLPRRLLFLLGRCCRRHRCRRCRCRCRHCPSSSGRRSCVGRMRRCAIRRCPFSIFDDLFFLLSLLFRLVGVQKRRSNLQARQRGSGEVGITADILGCS